MSHINNNGTISNFAQGDIHIGTSLTPRKPSMSLMPNRDSEQQQLLSSPTRPPKPSCVVPFRRDPDFVDRGTLLDQIREKCCAPASRVALVGLGGVGADVNQVSYLVDEHAEADIFQLVHDWLQDERKGRWVLILDNVDDARFLLEARGAGRDKETEGKGWQPLVNYVPKRQHGSVLVTTRSRNAARGLVDERDIVSIEPMERRDAVALLQKKLGQQEKSEEVVELATELECMPLAMVQAAAYIIQRRPCYSVKQYLANFRRSDRKKTALFDNEDIQVREELRRDREAKNSIIIKWQISFDYIRETRPSAAGLLSLMSFFDRQGIPEELLRARVRALPEEEPAQQEQHERDSERQAWEDEDSASQSSAGDDGFGDDVQTLRDYSFISANADGASFEMHRLVQLATRKWLQIHHELEQWKQHFVSNLCAAFPTGHHENWAVCQRLFAHANSAAEQRPEREDSLKDWASLLYKAAWYALEVGNWAEAEAMSLQSTKTRRKILGVDHEDTLWSMVNLASTYWNQGRWLETEALFVQVMETRKTKFGADHPDTLISMNNLAFTLKSCGFTSKAISLMKDCCELGSVVFGPQHPNLISFREAITTWQLEALEIQEQGES
ncbi:hypothetical protein DM02DRAFT_722561 [Periconia macrospinosa]|uniref:DUF7779 domain-containing protein n=1 Tax=Periconia macrospinosa TaxID=97972 RepID=A0A2V1CXE7_9PLEO|nr:hypothetical protein DM02DRAFT_722561 [Periconia macrospinosa]